jgi:4'-phosphopantetheinyl transferase
MAGVGWSVSRAAELPGDESWLSDRERTILEGLKFEKRRGDWLLGRWTAKRALSAWLTVAPERIEVIAAHDGVPEALVDREPAPASLSISHRGDRALAVTGPLDLAIGCDLEVVEPRSPAFLREWLSDAERALAGDDPLRANLIWCAKEAAAKARRGGLRLNVRRAEVSFDPAGGGWRRLAVRWQDEPGAASGWWREEPGWVIAVVAEPAAEAPERL